MATDCRPRPEPSKTDWLTQDLFVMQCTTLCIPNFVPGLVCFSIACVIHS